MCFEQAKTLWRFIVDANTNGDYFPVWGTCLGFQTICVMASGNQSILSRFNGVDGVSLPLNLTDHATDSRLFSRAPATVMATLTSTPSTVNLHHWGATPAAFVDNPDLGQEFVPLAINNDTDHSVFVSVIEGRRLPIWGFSSIDDPNLVGAPTPEHLGINHASATVAVSTAMA